MNINIGIVPYILVFTAVIPALLAFLVAKKQGRSTVACPAVALVLGLSWIGGWLYLAVLTLLAPKQESN